MFYQRKNQSADYTVPAGQTWNGQLLNTAHVVDEVTRLCLLVVAAYHQFPKHEPFQRTPLQS